MVISLNAEAQLDACLASVTFADDIVVVDSGSTDKTEQIAQRYGVRWIRHDWLGYGPQKQFAVRQAQHDWVLCLDVDERVTEPLRAAIQAALVAPRASAFEMARCNRFMGRWLRHGEGYPDWSLRLFDRRRAQWSDDLIHEKVIAPEQPARLTGDLLHDSADDLHGYLEKQNVYTTLQAEQLFSHGRQASALRLIISPLARFVKFYFLRLGFLDGFAGLVHISIGCFNSFSKQAKLFALHLKTRS